MPVERTTVFKVLIILAVLGIFLMVISQSQPSAEKLGIKPEKKLLVGGVEIFVEVADTQEEILQGLSNKPFMGENAGMFFDLKQKQIAYFWMRQMKFPLDIIWLDGEEIVGIEKNAPVPQQNNIPSFISPTPVNAVLEVNSGFTDKNNLQVGTKVELLR